MNVWAQIDKLYQRFISDMVRLEREVALLRGAGRPRVRPGTGMWSCRFRVYGSDASEMVQAMSVETLFARLQALHEKSEAARKEAREKRAALREEHKAELKRVKEALKHLGAKRVRARRGEEPGEYNWTCIVATGRGPTRAVREFEEDSAVGLIAAVRSHVSERR